MGNKFNVYASAIVGFIVECLLFVGIFYLMSLVHLKLTLGIILLIVARYIVNYILADSLLQYQAEQTSTILNQLIKEKENANIGEHSDNIIGFSKGTEVNKDSEKGPE